MPENEYGERLARIEQKLDDMFHQLIGNGQPGIVKDHEARIVKLEKVQYRLIGALFAGGATGGALGHKLMQWIGIK